MSGTIVWVPVQVPVSSIQHQLPTTYPFVQPPQPQENQYVPVLQLQQQQQQQQKQQLQLQAPARSSAAPTGGHASGAYTSYSGPRYVQQQATRQSYPQTSRNSAAATAMGRSRATATSAVDPTTLGDVTCEPAFLGEASCGYTQFGDNLPLPVTNNYSNSTI